MQMRDRVRRKSLNICGLASTCMTLLLPHAALAQDVSVSFGASVTSNYTSKGFTQTQDKPAFQPYAEFGYGLGYLSLWGSNVDFGEEDVELDVGIGIRPSIGWVDLDLGFVQYLYNKDSADYGEAFIYASAPVSETVYVELNYWYEVYAHRQTAYLGAGAKLPHGFSISGGMGSDFGTRDLDEDVDYGDIGISKSFATYYTFDLRGQFSTVEDTHLVGTLSVDF